MPVVHDLSLARVIHVLALVIWIGGVFMATTIALPAIRQGDLGPNRLKAFKAFEERFVWQARGAVLAAGLSGLYMVHQAGLWERFWMAEYWWMHAMVGVWVIFFLLLFVGEPLVLHKKLPAMVEQNPDTAFARLHLVHIILLGLSIITIVGAVAGSHGWSILWFSK